MIGSAVFTKSVSRHPREPGMRLFTASHSIGGSVNAFNRCWHKMSSPRACSGLMSVRIPIGSLSAP